MFKQPKEIKQDVDAFIRGKGVICSNELTAYIEEIAEPPEYKDLYHEYCQRYGNSRIRSLKGADGLRSHFSTGEKRNPLYVNFETANIDNLPEMKKAHGYQKQQRDQLDNNIKKMSRKITVVEGQIAIEEFMSNKEKEPDEILNCN